MLYSFRDSLRRSLWACFLLFLLLVVLGLYF